MSMRVIPLEETFGATVTDVEVAELDEVGFAELYEYWLQY